MKLQVKGAIQVGKGEQAEEAVLETLKEVYGAYEGKVFVNEPIPRKNVVPDFVVPTLNREDELVFIVIECKAARVTKVDGSTEYCNVYEQVNKYINALSECFKPLNKVPKVKAFAILPNAHELRANLKGHGRSGVKWGSLKNLSYWLKEFKPVSFDDPQVNNINVVYHYNRFLKNSRIHRFDKRQKEAASIAFGGTWKIGGLAGTGKTLILAEKMIKDSLEKRRNLLYLTQNKNLLREFTLRIKKELIQKGVSYIEHGDQVYPDRIELSDPPGSTLNFGNFDSFATRFITKKMDLILFGKDRYGPLYKTFLKTVGDDRLDYARCRQGMIDLLKPKRFTRSGEFKLFEGLYIDEFQDCRIDPTKALLPIMFVESLEDGDPNLIFTEDIFQSYVKYKALKDFDESFKDVKLKDLHSNKDLGISKASGGRVKNLNVIYRTPEKIFKTSIELLDYSGDLRKNKRQELEGLDCYLPFGSIEVQSLDNYHEQFSEKVNGYFPDEVLLISPWSEKELLIPSSKRELVHVASSDSPAKSGYINVLHEYNARGLEADLVFILVTPFFLENPNYLYTLICRTQREVVLVKLPGLDEVKLEAFINGIDLNLEAA